MQGRVSLPSFFCYFNVSQRVAHYGILKITLDDVGVYLCRVKLLVSEYILEYPDVDLSGLVHECCGSVS